MHGVPVIASAAEVQFAPAGKATFERVESRFVLMCQAGHGQVHVDESPFHVSKGSMLVLPWGPSLSYAADRDDPFLIGGAHLIPRHDTHTPIDPSIAPDPSHPLGRVS